MADKHTPSHDESISYLAATCHQEDYRAIYSRHRYPYGAWAPAAAWQRLWQPGRFMCFGQIANDLSVSDLHPPLYFWLLHVWLALFGTHLWSGMSLNLVLVALVAVALFGLARRVLGDPLEAALVATLWLVSPAVIGISSESRQYDLLALACVLFSWQVLRVADAPGRLRRRDAIALTLVTAFGALTQYIFGVVAFGAAGVLAWRLRRQLPRLLAALGSMAAGVAILVLLHPTFWRSFATERTSRSQPFSSAELPERTDEALRSIASFFAPKGHDMHSGRTLGVALVAAALLLAITALARQRGRSRWQAGAMVALFTWTAAVTVALYVTFVTPKNAMGSTYLAHAWPFFAFLPVLALRLAGPLRQPLAVILALGVLAMGAWSAQDVHRASARLSNPADTVGRADRLLVDAARRGVLPPMLWQARPTAQVLAADQDEVLRRRRLWLRRPPQAVVSVPFFGGGRGSERRIVGLLRASHRRVRRVGRIVLWNPERVSGRSFGRVYRVTPR